MARAEAAARVKIDRLLQAAGWRYFPDKAGPANVSLEPSVKLRPADLDRMGDDYQNGARGMVDFLLLDDKGFPLIVLEAKSESKDPLTGKEQARRYAKSLTCRFVILSNGNLHYFWDLERGNPYIITTFPSPSSVAGYKRVSPDPRRLVDEPVSSDYIVLTQRPNYLSEAAWRNEAERPDYIQKNSLRFLRPYQLKAIYALQAAVRDGKDRFLFEMATGTGKTLIAAAVAKLFLRSGNAQRVLFLVDRLELEEQARKALTLLLSHDYKTVVYKENRDDWRRAEIVVTTVQALLFNNKYQRLFSPTDFDVVISDEAHRSIGGNARAVFDYFVGYKLGLTATPKDYLKKFNPATPTTRDPRELERRLLLDTYRTFGCESGLPSFRYSLLDGVRDGYLVNPTVVDARTDVTTRLLSDQGYFVSVTGENGQDQEETYEQGHFEKRFFSDATNSLFCRTFLENALRDPISAEVGKSIIFAVSQRHAGKLAQILNQLADGMYPGRYQSDFAVQVTSNVDGAQQHTINFANNNLLGSGNFLPDYKTSKARVCVTVGMMTTGYDCTDILNLGLFRPVFSPTDFIQIKGRGTRKHTFTDQLFDEEIKAAVTLPHKITFKLMDFFGNYEYFEEDFQYDQVLTLPQRSLAPRTPPGVPPEPIGAYTYTGPDNLAQVREAAIGLTGMKIDRMFFETFEDEVRKNPVVMEGVEAGDWDRVIEYVSKELFDKPDKFYTLAKLRQAASVDRRLTLREILEKIFGRIPRFKTKDELLEEEFSKFVADRKPSEAAAIPAIKTFFKAYATSGTLRDIIDQKRYVELTTNPSSSLADLKAVPDAYRTLIPDYVKDYVPLNLFAA